MGGGPGGGGYRPRPPGGPRHRLQEEAAAAQTADGRRAGDDTSHVRVRDGERQRDRSLRPRGAEEDELPDPGHVVPPAHPGLSAGQSYRGAQV